MLTINRISFPDKNTWEKILSVSNSPTFFQTYDWMSLWIKHFGNPFGKSQGRSTEIWGIKDGDKMIGIIPLLKESEGYSLIPTSSVLNNQEVSDYGEVIVERGREEEVISGISRQGSAVRGQGFGEKITLDFIREDSASLPVFKQLRIALEEQDTAPYIHLPLTFDEYLSSLNRHNRHELKRKLRRFEESGGGFEWFDGSKEQIERFFQLMEFDQKKKSFLTDPMKLFFAEIIHEFYKKGRGTILFIQADEKLVAGIILFYFQEEVLLYNSGFDPDYFHLSPGLMVVTEAISDSILKGKKVFDFLRGSERYKYDLGGIDRKLYRGVIT